MSTKISKHRKSVFRELGLDTDAPTGPLPSEQEFTELTGVASPISNHTPESANGNDNENENENENTSDDGRGEMERLQTRQRQDDNDESRADPTSPSTSQRSWYSRLGRVRRPRIRTVSSAPPPNMSTITRLSSFALLIAVLLPGYSYYNGRHEVAPNFADAGVIHTTAAEAAPVLEVRDSSPTKVCKRWAHQSELKSQYGIF